MLPCSDLRFVAEVRELRSHLWHVLVRADALLDSAPDDDNRHPHVLVDMDAFDALCGEVEPLKRAHPDLFIQPTDRVPTV